MSRIQPIRPRVSRPTYRASTKRTRTFRRAVLATTLFLTACAVPRKAGDPVPEIPIFPEYRRGNIAQQLLPDQTVINSFHDWSNAITYFDQKLGGTSFLTQIFIGIGTFPTVFVPSAVYNLGADVQQVITGLGSDQPLFFRKVPPQK